MLRIWDIAYLSTRYFKSPWIWNAWPHSWACGNHVSWIIEIPSDELIVKFKRTCVWLDLSRLPSSSSILHFCLGHILYPSHLGPSLPSFLFLTRIYYSAVVRSRFLSPHSHPPRFSCSESLVQSFPCSTWTKTVSFVIDCSCAVSKQPSGPLPPIYAHQVRETCASAADQCNVGSERGLVRQEITPQLLVRWQCKSQAFIAEEGDASDV